MTRAALYARFSTDRQNPATIEDQLRQCDQYALAKCMTVVARITDEAKSGAASKTRPGVLHLLELVKGGKIDIIVCTSPDRLTRDPELSEKLLKVLPFYGVEAHYSQKGGTMSDMELRVRALVSAEQLDDVRIKTWQGQRGHMLRGKAVAGLAYGYKIVIQHDSRGDRIPGLRAIDPEQAEVVRRIFRDYSLDVSPRAIAKALNDEGIRGPGGELWRDTTIRGQQKRGTGILNNETYVGVRVWNRQRYLKNPETEKRISRINDAQVIEIVEVPELRIVDQPLWDLVKVQQSLRTKIVEEAAGNRLSGNRRPAYLFSGMIECGECSGPYAIMGADRYGCTNHRKDRGCTNARTISRQQLEQRVNSAIPDALLTPPVIEEIRANASKLLSASRGKSEAPDKELKTKLSKVQVEIDNLVLAFKAGARSATMIEEMAKADRTKEELSKQIAERKSREAPAKVKVPVPNQAILNLAAHALGHAATLGSDNELARAWKELVRTMIEKIVVHPLAPRGVALEVHGRLVVLLATLEAWNAEEARLKKEFWDHYASLRSNGQLLTVKEKLRFVEEMNAQIQKRKRSFERFLTSRLTLVAGAGFEPATFRL
ncbi:recombinase family protein [Devosia alba]|uniref:recombinase family protein n=1 Tax=Devosia alba TaxID=3152360 RepID=UPI003D359CE3